MKEAYLVTGGAGFIGSHLVERLLAEGKDVIVIDNFDNYYDPKVKHQNIEPFLDNPSFKLCKADLRNIQELQEIFASHRITGVFHLAARGGVRASLDNPFPHEEINIRGTLNLLKVCERYNLGFIIFASSSTVYGEGARLPFTESEKLGRPISYYAVTKRTGELLMQAYHSLHGTPVTCLRFFTVYGPRQRPDMAISKFIRSIDKGKTISIFGNGYPLRDYVYVSDVIDGILLARRHVLGFEVINIGSGETVGLARLISLIELYLNKKARVEILPAQAGDVSITYANIEKAKTLLGYEPEIKIGEGINKFINDFS